MQLFSSVSSSVTQSCLTLCDPMDWGMPGFSVHHQLLKLVQTHVHRVSDAIQSSRPLLSPFSHFSLSDMSNSLQPHGLQHTRLPYPSPTPGACSNSHPSSQWCHPSISSSVVPFSSCLQSFPASGSFPMSPFFASGGQSIAVQLQHQSFQWIFRTDFL